MGIETNQHDVIKGLFAGSSVMSTSSPAGFIKESATASTSLLLERQIRNKRLIEALKNQSKELKGISKNTGNGLGLVDLVLARYATKVLNGTFRLGVRGSVALGGGAAVLLRGLPALTGKIFSGVFGGIAEAIRFNILYLTRVGIPSLAKVPGLGTLLSKGGLLLGISKMLSGTLALGKKLISPSLLGKIFWPLTAAYTLYLGVNGYKDADKVLGKPVTGMFKRIQVGITESLNGLLFGLPNKMAQYFGAEGFSRWVEGGINKLGVMVTQDIPAYLKSTTYSILSGLRTRWNNFNVGNALNDVKTWIVDSISALGAYLGSGIMNVFGDIANTVKSISVSNGNSSKYRSQIPPKPSSKMYIPNQDEDKASSLYNRRNAAITPLIRTGAISVGAAGNIPHLLTSDNMPKDSLGRIITSNASVMGDMPNKAVDWFNKGNETMQVYGQALATSHAAETVTSIAPTQTSIVDGMTQSFSEMFNKDWLETMSGFLGNIPELMKKQMKDMFNAKNMATIGNIMSGNAPSFDMAGAMQGMGAPVTQRDRMPGSVPYQGIMPNAPVQNPIIRRPAGGRYRGGELADGVDLTTSAYTSVSKNVTKREVTDAMLATGADPRLVAGITGNIDIENPKWDARNEQADPSRSNPGQRAAGLVQWDQSRTRNLKAFAAERGLDPNDAKTQGLFALEEANPKSKYVDRGAASAARQILQNPNISAGEAAAIYMQKSERPAAWAANSTMARRMAAAERNYADIKQQEIVATQAVVDKPKVGSTSAYTKPGISYEGVAYGGMKSAYMPIPASPTYVPEMPTAPQLDSRGNVNLGYTPQANGNNVKMASQTSNVRIESDATPVDLKEEVNRAIIMQQANQPTSVHDGPKKKKRLDITKDDDASEDLAELSMLLHEDVGQQ